MYADISLLSTNELSALVFWRYMYGHITNHLQYTKYKYSLILYIHHLLYKKQTTTNVQ